MSFVTQQRDDGSYHIVDSAGATVFQLQTSGQIGSAETRITLTNTLARTDTTAKNLFVLPAGAIPLSMSIYSGTASDAATTAVVSVGKTGTATYFVSAQDVKGASGQLPCAAAAHLGVSVGAAAVQVIGTYAETGSASTTGGPFRVTMDYVLS